MISQFYILRKWKEKNTIPYMLKYALMFTILPPILFNRRVTSLMILVDESENFSFFVL